MDNVEKKIDCPVCEAEQSVFVDNRTNVTSYYCDNCGYISNTKLIIDSEYTKKIESRMPDLIKDYIYNDMERHIIWYLSSVVTSVAAIFPSRNEITYSWIVARYVPVLEDEKEDFKDPNREGKYFDKKLDVENSVEFNTFKEASNYFREHSIEWEKEEQKDFKKS